VAILSDNDVIGYAAKIDDRVMATRQGRLIFFYDPEKLLKFIDDLSVKGHEVMLHGLGFDFLLEIKSSGNEGLFLDVEHT